MLSLALVMWIQSQTSPTSTPAEIDALDASIDLHAARRAILALGIVEHPRFALPRPSWAFGEMAWIGFDPSDLPDPFDGDGWCQINF